MQIVANIVVLASLYCLICCGYVLIYRASRVLNLAHGEMMTLGGYFLFTVILAGAGSPIASLGIALVLSLLLGFAVYFFLMRFLTGESVLAAVLVTVALGIFLRGLITLGWTSQSWHPLERMHVENATQSTLTKNPKKLKLMWAPSLSPPGLTFTCPMICRFWAMANTQMLSLAWSLSG